MRLSEEIAALRKELADRSNQQSTPSAKAEEGAAADVGVQAVLASVGEIVDELGGNVDKFPRLSVIAAFGLGLALGAALGRQLR